MHEIHIAYIVVNPQQQYNTIVKMCGSTATGTFTWPYHKVVVPGAVFHIYAVDKLNHSYLCGREFENVLVAKDAFLGLDKNWREELLYRAKRIEVK